MPESKLQPWPGRDGALLIFFTSVLLATALYKGEPRAFAPVALAFTSTAAYLGWTRWMRA